MEPSVLIKQADALVRHSLIDLVSDLRATAWAGRRENEVRSLYAFGHLVTRCHPDHFLRDPTQIALDVPVPQIEAEAQRALSGGTGTPKRDVAKDLVIWPRPRMTCWVEDKADAHPTVLIEWKVNRTSPSSYDVAWLQRFSASREAFVGYAVAVDLGSSRYALACTRVQRGHADARWLSLD
ncbi:MAG: hypothetical protein AAGF99_08390 [Bacteroidota bacterium]